MQDTQKVTSTTPIMEDTERKNSEIKQLNELFMKNRALNDLLEEAVKEVLSPKTGGKKTYKTKDSVNTKYTPTKQKIRIGSVERVVYQGPRGGKYIRKNGQYLNIKSLK
jgi:hypothetical protein